MNVMEDKIWSIFEYNFRKEDSITIDERKEINYFLKESKMRAKRNECFYCKNQVSSFCNSHSIPAFTLRNIAKDGQLITLNSFIKMPFIDKISGLQKTGTFQLICRDCDSKIFSDYENPENYKMDIPNQKMLSQISLKTHLNAISKKHIENKMFEKLKNNNVDVDTQLNIKKLDLDEHYSNYLIAKRNLTKNWEEYYVFYYKTLDYTVPIAFQDEINLISDFNGKLINEIYNMDRNYQIKGMNVCVFPLKQKSVIIMFVHKNNAKRYRGFYKTLKSKSEIEQLEIINFIIFSYSENVFLSPFLTDEILENSNLKSIAKLSIDSIIETDDLSKVKFYKLITELYDFSRSKEIPNLLSLKIDSFKSE